MPYEYTLRSAFILLGYRIWTLIINFLYPATYWLAMITFFGGLAWGDSFFMMQFPARALAGLFIVGAACAAYRMLPIPGLDVIRDGIAFYVPSMLICSHLGLKSNGWYTVLFVSTMTYIYLMLKIQQLAYEELPPEDL